MIFLIADLSQILLDYNHVCLLFLILNFLWKMNNGKMHKIPNLNTMH